MASHEVVEPLLDPLPCKPALYSLRTKLDEYPFTPVLHCRKPSGLQGDLRAFHVGLVFPVNVRRDRLQARETD